jgi:hypothetical protein
MWLDERNEFADAVSVAASAGTALIGDVMDLGAAPGDLGPGDGLYLVIQTDTEIITGGSAGTIQFFLVSDGAADLASAVVANCTTHIATAAYVTDDSAANSAELNAGGVIYCGKLPYGAYERYLGILCTTASNDVTAGKVNAFLTSNVAKWKPYADAAN